MCHSKSTGLTISLDFHIFIYLVPLSLCVLRTLKAYKDILYNRLDTAVSLVHGNCFCLVKLRHVIKCYRENESRLTMLTKMVWCSSSGLFVAPSGVETIGDVPSTMMLPSRHSNLFFNFELSALSVKIVPVLSLVQHSKNIAVVSTKKIDIACPAT